MRIRTVVVSGLIAASLATGVGVAAATTAAATETRSPDRQVTACDNDIVSRAGDDTARHERVAQAAEARARGEAAPRAPERPDTAQRLAERRAALDLACAQPRR